MPARTPQPHKFLYELEPYVPGKASIKGRTRLHKLSSNETALSPSPKAIAAYHAQARRLLRYPDGSAQALRATLARHHKVEAKRIVCGNGSGELVGLLARLFLAPGLQAVYSQHGFLLYGQVTRLCGARACAVRETALRPDLSAMAKHARQKCPIIFLANPNNPTACFIPLAQLRRWHRDLPTDTLLVLDYAYGEYLPAEELAGVYRWAQRAKNIVVLGTFSKAYGLAALRVGWGYCPAPIADMFMRIREPFNVNHSAQACAIAALGDTAHVAKVVAHTRHWKQWLLQQLGGLGFSVHGGEGNFVMIEFATPAQANHANRHLLAAGIIVRQLAAYGLAHCLRLTIGTAQDMRAVQRALAQWALKQPTLRRPRRSRAPISK